MSEKNQKPEYFVIDDEHIQMVVTLPNGKKEEIIIETMKKQVKAKLDEERLRKNPKSSPQPKRQYHNV